MKETLSGSYYSHYNQPSLWGHDQHEVNKKRAQETVRMIPEDTDSILDLGCGDGIITNLLNEKYSVTGADISLEALKYIKSRKICADSSTLPFKSHSFDLVLANEVLEHLPVPIYKPSLAEIQRTAEKYILISVPYDEFLNLSYAKCRVCGCVFHSARHVRKFNDYDLQGLFTEFELKEKKYIAKNHETATAFEMFLRHNLGDDYYYYSETLTCPICFAVVSERKKRGVFSYAAALIRRMCGIFMEQKPLWVCALYQKTQ